MWSRCFWLVALGTAEWLAARRAHRGAIPSPVVGAARIVASLAYGAVIFQAAQSLQVPAYEPRLVGLWGLGLLVYAYVVRALSPLVIGLALTAGWYVWQVVSEAGSGLAVVLALLVGGVVAVAVATAHRRWRAELAAPWREYGALLLLVGLFAAAIPEIGSDDFSWTADLLAGLVVAALLTVAGVLLGQGRRAVRTRGRGRPHAGRRRPGPVADRRTTPTP